MSSNPKPIKPPRRIVVRGVNWLGDAVMTTPALQRLREAFPDAHITLLTHEKLAELWKNHPSINTVLTFRAKQSALSIARKLRTAKADTALIFPNSQRSAIEVWLARIPQRVGFKRSGRNSFLTHAVTPRDEVRMRKRTGREVKKVVRAKQNPKPDTINPAAHQSLQYLNLIAALGANAEPVAPRLFVTPDEVDAALNRFQLEQNPRVPLFGMFPGAEYGPAKRWPRERFIEVATRIQKQTGCRWLIFGGAGDVELAAHILGEIQYEATRLPVSGKIPPEPVALNLAGQTSLRELCALLKVCGVMLSNDSGPMHVAAALGTPVVVPFGSTSAALTGPGLPGDEAHELLISNAPCSPCFLRECPIDFRCMNGISVDEVVKATMRAANRKIK